MPLSNAVPSGAAAASSGAYSANASPAPLTGSPFSSSEIDTSEDLTELKKIDNILSVNVVGLAYPAAIMADRVARLPTLYISIAEIAVKCSVCFCFLFGFFFERFLTCEVNLI